MLNVFLFWSIVGRNHPRSTEIASSTRLFPLIAKSRKISRFVTRDNNFKNTARVWYYDILDNNVSEVTQCRRLADGRKMDKYVIVRYLGPSISTSCKHRTL